MMLLTLDWCAKQNLNLSWPALPATSLGLSGPSTGAAVRRQEHRVIVQEAGMEAHECSKWLEANTWWCAKEGSSGKMRHHAGSGSTIPSCFHDRGPQMRTLNEIENDVQRLKEANIDVGGPALETSGPVGIGARNPRCLPSAVTQRVNDSDKEPRAPAPD